VIPVLWRQKQEKLGLKLAPAKLQDSEKQTKAKRANGRELV
jgi:hypothetical protein